MDAVLLLCRSLRIMSQLQSYMDAARVSQIDMRKHNDHGFGFRLVGLYNGRLYLGTSDSKGT